MLNEDRQLCICLTKSRDYSYAHTKEILERCTNNFFLRTWKFPKDKTGYGYIRMIEVKSSKTSQDQKIGFYLSVE